jgi:hypothetical protein
MQNHTQGDASVAKTRVFGLISRLSYAEPRPYGVRNNQLEEYSLFDPEEFARTLAALQIILSVRYRYCFFGKTYRITLVFT